MTVPSEQHGAETAARVIFYIECGLNIFTSLQCFLFLSKFLMNFIPRARQPDSAQFVDPLEASDFAEQAGARPHGFKREQPTFQPIALELSRWYGVLLTVLTYGEARALISVNDSALAIIQEALLLGDVIHFFAAWSLARAVGGWAVGNVVGAGLAWFLAGWRIYWIQLHYRYDA